MSHPLFRFGLCFLIAIFLLTSGNFSSAQPEGRIVGGTLSAPGAWPFMVAIFMQRNATIPARQWCGGVVWNEDTILTAAHCLVDFRKEPIEPFPATICSVLLGQTDISSPVPEYTFQAAQLLTHPKYYPRLHLNDVGIIKLDRPIDFTGAHPKAACICDPLPVSGVNGSACLALGWGLTSPSNEATSPVLMQVDLPLLPPDVCAKHEPNFDATMNVCAGHLGVGGKDTCKGDSGGPLLCQLPGQPDKYSLVGLTSFGSVYCDTMKEPGYYTKVETYLQWIGEASGE